MAPTRTCVTCRARRDDGQLVRLARDGAGTWYHGRGPGRGVWCCDRSSCRDGRTAIRLARALRVGVEEVDLEVVRGLDRDSRVVVEE